MNNLINGESTTNWKYILIVIILGLFVVGGVLSLFIFREETNPLTITITEKIGKPILNLTTTRLATISEEYDVGDPYGVFEPTFSPDGTRVAYIATKGRSQYSAVIDGRASEDYSFASWLIFSPDSKHTAYMAGTPEGYFMVVDGKREGVYDKVGRPFFSPNSKHLVYYVEKGEKRFIVFDGKEHENYDFIDMHSIIFSPDSNKMAYVAAQEGKQFIVIDDYERNIQKEKFYDGVGYPVFSPDGKKLAYPARTGKEYEGKEFMVIDGGEINKIYTTISSWYTRPVFSPDGSQIAYVARKYISVEEDNYKEFIVINYKEGKNHDSVNFPIFSPDGKHIAYQAAEKEAGERFYFVVVDDKEGKKYAHIAPDSLVFSPDGKHLVYGAGFSTSRWAKDWNQFMVVDDREGKIYDGVYDIIFSSDSKYLAYGARIGNELWWIADEVEYYAYLKEFDKKDYLPSNAQNINVKKGDINGDNYDDVLVYYEVLDELLPNYYQAEGKPNKYYLRTYLFNPITVEYEQKREDQGTYHLMYIENYEFFDFNQDGKQEILVVKRKEGERKEKFWYIMYERDNKVEDAQIDKTLPEELTKRRIGNDIISIKNSQLIWRFSLHIEKDSYLDYAGGIANVIYKTVFQEDILKFLIAETSVKKAEGYKEKDEISCEYKKGKYEMRIYDSQGGVTGIINGEIKEEIPNSAYDFESGQAVIFFPTESYIYEIFSLEEGNYVFEENSTEGGEPTYFNAYNIPIFPGMTHRYQLDWEAINQGKEGVTLLVDFDSDGIFEKTITSNNELTCKEFLTQLDLPLP